MFKFTGHIKEADMNGWFKGARGIGSHSVKNTTNYNVSGGTDEYSSISSVKNNQTGNTTFAANTENRNSSGRSDIVTMTPSGGFSGQLSTYSSTSNLPKSTTLKGSGILALTKQIGQHRSGYKGI